jgi:diguanylate cyclase (GGDEF)-like protein
MSLSFLSRWFSSTGHGAFQRRASKVAIVLALVTLVGVRFFSLNNVIEDRRDQWQTTLQSINNISILVEQDIERSFDGYDRSLTALADKVTAGDVMREDPARRQALLFDPPLNRDGWESQIILDETGSIIVDSEAVKPRQGNFADRTYFRIHKDKADAGLYISRPLRSRLRNGEWMIALSRRISHPDGSFAGVAVGAIGLDNFKRLFAKVVLTANDSITLFGTDGGIIVRWPFNETMLGQRLDDPQLLKSIDQASDGHVIATSYSNGEQRLNDYRRIGHLPLIQKVGMSLKDTSPLFWATAIISAACFIILCLAVFALTLQLESELRRRQDAEAALEELATTDKLTGLANRRKFDELLAFEWRRAERENTPFSLLMLDADLFKAYNDTYGHQAGDKVLRGIADCIKAGINRPADLAARYGGEEFAVLLPDTDHMGAFHIAEAIRARVFATALEHEKSPYGVVTASIGLACIYPRQTEDSAKLLRAADDALYLAKASGRNRVAPPQPFQVRRAG